MVRVDLCLFDTFCLESIFVEIEFDKPSFMFSVGATASIEVDDDLWYRSSKTICIGACRNNPDSVHSAGRNQIIIRHSDPKFVRYIFEF